MQADDRPERLRVRVRGSVQGVGFRPFVYGLAERYGLSGFVLNDQDGVLAEIEGHANDMFLSAMRHETPALARIDTVDVSVVPALGVMGFAIHESVGAGPNMARGVPDAATCDACLRDLFDPESRFHLYPFVTCSDCGPRFTISRRSPYDRDNTVMAEFMPCRACAADYRDPISRRFHAETIACPACGPKLDHRLIDVAAAISEGLIVALKGIGGFHLLSDATNDAAVRRLRLRKQRPARPFAIMIASEATLRPLVEPTPAERTLLGRSSRPIVLIRKGSGLADSVAPSLDLVGVMLASTPIHALLFRALAQISGEASAPSALVATSANVAGEPLVIANEVAGRDLSAIADLIVTHDRIIVQRADDSVMKMIDGAPAFIRRGRGFVPDPIDLGEDGPSVIAVGAHLKATICITHGREAFISSHLGDLNTIGTVQAYQDTARRMLDHLGIGPELAACDLHPDYQSTRFAEGLGLPLLRVQHHAAHLAAVVAEHQLCEPVIGVALDGHGYGADGGAWGGELMLDDDAGWRRGGHLRALALPGGDRAAREPWRMGLAAMIALGRESEVAGRFSHHPLAGPLCGMVLASSAAPDATSIGTTSMGRLFDAAAALLRVCEDQSYEGQAAMELEALVETPSDGDEPGYRFDGEILDFTPILETLLGRDMTPREGAALFHGAVIAGLADWIGRCAGRTGRKDIALAGGCFINRVLADGLSMALRRRGLTPWLPHAVPANDGGISFGQAALARAHLVAGRQ